MTMDPLLHLQMGLPSLRVLRNRVCNDYKNRKTKPRVENPGKFLRFTPGFQHEPYLHVHCIRGRLLQ